MFELLRQIHCDSEIGDANVVVICEHTACCHVVHLQSISSIVKRFKRIYLGLECRNVVDTSVQHILFTLNTGLMHLLSFTDGSSSSFKAYQTFATIRMEKNSYAGQQIVAVKNASKFPKRNPVTFHKPKFSDISLTQKPK
jgi:hypothetical protein